MSDLIYRLNWLGHMGATGWVEAPADFSCSHPTHAAEKNECDQPAFIAEYKMGTITGRALCWDHREQHKVLKPR